MEIQKWKKKKDKFRIEGNSDSLYFACKELAELYFNAGKYDSALQEYKEMERMSEISGNKMDVGRANRMIGEVYCEKGEFEKAIKHQLKHLVLSREEQNKVEEQRALATLGRTYFLQAESILDTESTTRGAALKEAKKYYMESLSICDKLTDEVGQKQRMEMVARLFLNIGLVLDCQYLFESAIDHMQKAVSICRKLDLWEDLYRTYSALGGAYHKHGDKNASIKTFDLALTIAERLNNKIYICEVLQLKADVLLDLPELRGARQALLKAYKMRVPDNSMRDLVEKKLRIVAAMSECEGKLASLPPETEFVERKKLYEEMGDAAAELGNFKLALSYYHLMLECVQQSGSEKKALIDSYVSLAQTYKDDQQYSKSLQYFQEELKLEEQNSPEACKTLLNIAELHQLLGNRSEMYETLEQAKKSSMGSDTKIKITVLSLLHAALIEDKKIENADLIKREINKLERDQFECSSDEEEDVVKEFGKNIDLDELTDEEAGEEKREEKARRKRSVNIEKRNEKGETPLHVAAIQGNLTLVHKLLDQGHRVDVKDYSGWTPLHEACNHGHCEVVKVLLDRGAPINDRGGPHCDGVTPLLDAASNGNLDVIQLLLNYGASPLMRTNSGDSILDCLSGWRKRRYEELGIDLEGSILAQYSTIYKNLEKILENAGQKTLNKETSPTFTNQGKQRKSFDSSALTRPSTGQNTLNKETSPTFSNQGKQRKSFDSTISQRHSGLETKIVKSSKNAANEYENTMKALRFRSSDYRPLKLKETVGGGLLPENQDDWLEEDVRPQKKRRTGDHELITGSHSRSRDSARETVGGLVNDDHDDWLEDDLRPQKKRRTIDDEPTQGTASSSSTESSERTRRSSSIDDSQQHEHPPSPPVNNSCFRHVEAGLEEISVVRKKSIERSNHERESPVHLNPSPTKSNFRCLKVRIEGKVILVPVPGGGEGLTISWLATEAASRYKRLMGAEPELELEMEGGGLLVSSDPLSLIIDAGSLVEGRVLSWHLSHPLTLYQEACQHLKTSCDEEVECVLEGSEATGTVSVADLYLSWQKMAPLLKALTHYQPLQAVILSSNNISDLHILDVAECVAKLPHLRILDLSNTNITDKGLEKFADCINKNSGLQNLEELLLGYNPLGECLRPLSALLTSTSQLRALSIPDIGLTRRSFPSSFGACVLGNLEVLDASWNELSVEGVREILSLVNSRQLRELCLAGTGVGVLREVGLFLELQAPPALTHLDLSHCPYSSQDLQHFISGVKMCESLKNVSLGGEMAPGDVSDLLALNLEELCVSCPSPAQPASCDKLVLTSPHAPAPYGLLLFTK